jgi:hypothetical protein
MKSLLAIAAAMTLLIPAMAFAQNNQHKGPGGGGGRPAAHAPHPGGGRPMVRPGHPGGPGGGMAHRPGPRPGMAHGPRPGGHGGHFAGRPGPRGNRFSYHGHYYNRVHGGPWAWPHGYGYRHWGIGGILPAIFLSSAYFYADYAAFGMGPPPPGFQWVRYGPDLVLVNLATGQITNIVYGVFY